MLNEETKQHWDKIFVVTPLFAFVMFGFVLSEIAGNVLFVERVGSQFLPYTYVLNTIFGTLTALFVAGGLSQGKLNVIRLMQLVAVAGTAVLTWTYVMILNDVAWSYWLLLIFIQLLYLILAGIMMWDLGFKICTPFEAKRTFSYFSLGASVGGILAGLLSSQVSKGFGTEILIPFIIGSLILVFLHGFVIQIFFPEELKPEPRLEERSQWESIKEGFKYYRTSKLARMLGYVVLVFATVRLIGDYEFQKLLGEAFSEEQFATISGYVSIAENAVLILSFLFFQRWILSRIGIINTLFASPVIVLLPFMALFFFPIAIIAILLKVFTKVAQLSTFNSTLRLIYTAIPHAVRSSVVTFIDSNSESGSMLIAGAGLILLTNILPNEWIIAIGVALVLLTLLMVIGLKREYLKQIKLNLDSADPTDKEAAIEDIAEPSFAKEGVQELMKMLQKPDLDTETIRKIVFALGQVNNVNVIPSLLVIFEKYDITVKYAVVDSIHSFPNLNERLKDLPFTRLNLIETYQKIFLTEEDADLKIFILEHLRDFDPDNVITFLKETIKNKNPNVQYQAIKAMKYFKDRGIIRYIRTFLDNKNPMIQASTIIALWQFTEMRPQLVQRFVLLMTKTDKASILATFFIIAKANITWENKHVENYLTHKDPQIQTMAALTLMQVGNSKGLNIILDSLVEKTDYSLLVARDLKNFPEKMKIMVLDEVRREGSAAIQNAITYLRATYLNYTKEINHLTGAKSQVTRFSTRLTV